MGLTRTRCVLIFVLAFVVWHYSAPACCYRPVIMMHGVLSNKEAMAGLAGFITAAHPGTTVHNIDAYNDVDSVIYPMWTQVDGVWSKIQPFVDNATDGVHFVCYSQGGLLCRAIIEKYASNVQNFISLSSPHAGQYGDTDYFKGILPNISREIVYKVFYTKDAQKHISVANYWNDPKHQSLYHQFSNFLPFINNGSGSTYKSNFASLQKLVLVGGPDDGVITPWQSSHFAFYDEFGYVRPMQDQEFFLNDSFGLQTLYNRKRIQTYSIPGVQHTHWHTNKTVFDCCIEPYLD